MYDLRSSVWTQKSSVISTQRLGFAITQLIRFANTKRSIYSMLSVFFTLCKWLLSQLLFPCRLWFNKLEWYTKLNCLQHRKKYSQYENKMHEVAILCFVYYLWSHAKSCSLTENLLFLSGKKAHSFKSKNK